MLGLISRYTRWLHTQWPAGRAEKLPEVREDGSTNVPGLYVVGDLTGIPLLKFSADTGARVVRKIHAELSGDAEEGTVDVAIIGGGVSGMAAALEARKLGRSFVVFEATERFSTIVNFPRGKPIYTYPTDMTPAGELQFTAQVKEPLIDELVAQTAGIEPVMARVDAVKRAGKAFEVQLAGGDVVKARRVVIGIGRSGNFRKLGVPGEDLDKVSNRLHDPKAYARKRVTVVGGGDSALEFAIALAQAGAKVTLSYRKAEFSRPKPDNVDALNELIADVGADVTLEEPSSERQTTCTGRWVKEDLVATGVFETQRAIAEEAALVLRMSTQVARIEADSITLSAPDGSEETIPNDAVFVAIGREAPLDFFRRCGVRITGERTPRFWLTFGAFALFIGVMYHWKSHYPTKVWFKARDWFPHNMTTWLQSLTASANDPSTFIGTVALSLQEPSFWYSAAYCLCIIVFGIRRIRRRRTPYVKRQTITLALIQVIPLFLLPFILLPWMGHNGWFENWLGNELFPKVGYDPQGREYWRASGFILAWPLFVWNVFTGKPMWVWLGISLIQTFVIIPIIIRKWGKGAYCGWICSCGALAETMGDAHRHKMPHGPGWNRFNMLGQAFLLFAFVLLGLRVAAWISPGGWAAETFTYLFQKMPAINYAYMVDLWWAGIIGLGCYFHFSGRVWCRFGCPLAALMHIYARFSVFRIVADKKKCISCHVCTSVCHQGIDIMNFANKGVPMNDPQCVRCSACVQSCPTGVLQFGQVDPRTNEVIRVDKLAASPVVMAEKANR